MGSGLVPASILIHDGRIVSVGRHISQGANDTLRGDGLIALPGMLDAHVHLRDLELSYKEDFTTGTAAAAAGGFTTVLDMPNTRPVTDSSTRLREKIERARGRILTNVGFHAAAVLKSNQIEQMARLGAFSLKLYMPNPVSPLNVQNNRTVLRLLQTSHESGLPVTVHAEDSALISPLESNKTRFLDLARNHPEQAEYRAVDSVLRQAETTGCSLHLCHLTLPSSVTSARKHRRVTTEVTPHHVLLSEEAIKRKKWKAWMIPPLRSENVRKKLLAMLSGGLVTMVASDHAPHTIREKTGYVADSMPGVPGLETTLPLMLTLVNRRVLSLSLLIELLSSNPAHVFNLPGKGSLRKGCDGDVILVDLKKKARIRPDRFHSKAKYSPFENMLVQGQVLTTVVGGKVVFHDGEIIGKPGCGKVVRMGVRS